MVHTARRFVQAQAAGLILLSAPLAVEAGRLGPLEVNVGETVEITRSHSWCWFPTIHKFESGVLLVSVVLCPDQLQAESTNSGYCLSQDGGKTWGPRHAVGQGASHDGVWSEIPDNNGAIRQCGSYVEARKEGSLTELRGTMTTYSRDGRAISQDRDIHFTLNKPGRMVPTGLFDYKFDGKAPVSDTSFTKQFGGRPWGNIISAPDGALLCPGYLTTQEDVQRMNRDAKTSGPKGRKGSNRTILFRSTDDGKTWQEHGLIAAVPEGPRPEWIGREGFNEGSIAMLPDNRLYAVYRSGGTDGKIGHGWSSDGGKTWTEPVSIGFQGVAPRLHRLKNGMLALATGRPGPVQLRFNVDGHGRKWSAPITLFTEKSTRYCDFAEVEPGKLLVVYDSVPYGWHAIPPSDCEARNKILGTFVTYTESKP